MSQRNKKKHITLLLALAVGMFGFAFALVPLYDVFCEITGLNGKTSGQAELLAEIDGFAAPTDREVKACHGNSGLWTKNSACDPE